MFKNRFMCLLVFTLVFVFLFGCDNNTKRKPPNETNPIVREQQSTGQLEPTLANVHLGDSMDTVNKVLGTDYIETIEEESAYYGEPQVVWSYENSIELRLGRTSQKVLCIRVFDPKFATDLSVKVGDNAKEAFDKCRSKYAEYKGANSEEINQGWFLIGGDKLLILDCSSSDSTKLNQNIKDSSKVEVIELAYLKHFD